jgi:CDGSH iron-sulfur domain-containing protein 3
MEKPNIAANHPNVCELEAGTHYWCACGHSANGSFCDGSHKTTPFTPLKFEMAETKMVAICQCKQTKNPPYCDGSHKAL